MEGKKIVVAGGSGLVGEALVNHLRELGHEVYVLSRTKSKEQFTLHWDPKQGVIDPIAIAGTEVLINLSGQGIADKRWTKERKQALITSRVEPTHFLFSSFKASKDLKHYISASGINCYPLDQTDKVFTENDELGTDFLSHVVKKWEESADQFEELCTVAKLRISVVLTQKGGALETIAKPIKLYVGSPLGSGKQWMPWITLFDLVRMFTHVMDHQLSGAFNALAKADSNKVFTQELAKALNKPLFLPNVPAFVLKLALGEMSTLVLEGVNASHEKIESTGFNFQFTDLDQAFQFIYK